MTDMFTPADYARLDKLIERAFPSRAPSVVAKIREKARYLVYLTDPEAKTIATIKELESQFGPEFARETPSPEDYVAVSEAARTARGLETTGEHRIALLHKARAMSPDQLCEAVPFEKTAPKEPAPVAPQPIGGDELDRKIEYAFGMVPGTIHSLPPSKVRDYRKAFAEVAAPKTHTTETPVGRELTPAERIAQHRRTTKK